MPMQYYPGGCIIVIEIPSLSARDMNFVCTVFNLKKEELRCYTRKQSRLEHLNC